MGSKFLGLWLALCFFWSTQALSQTCSSAIVFQNHNDKKVACSIPADGLSYKKARTSACPPEKYNLCEYTVDVSVKGLFYSHFNEQKPGDNAANVNCQLTVKNSIGQQFITDQVLHVFSVRALLDRSYWSGPDEAHIGYTANDGTMRGNIKAEATWWGLRELPPPLFNEDRDNPLRRFEDWRSVELLSMSSTGGRRTGEKGAGSNWWFMDCDFEASYRVTVSSWSPRCGVQTFSECRDQSHGIEGSVYKQYCPINDREILTLGLEDAAKSQSSLLREGELTCETLDSMPEKTEADVASKIKQLERNLNLLKTATENQSIVPPGTPQPSVFTSWGLRTNQIDVLLQLNRLYRIARRTDGVNSSRDQLIELIESMNQGAGNPLVDDWVAQQNVPALVAFRQAFPEPFRSLANAFHPQFLELNPIKYSFLFPNGVTLSDEELYDAQRRIEFMDGPVAIYRLAEAAVRTGLDQIRIAQNHVLDLIDLKVSSYREAADYTKIAADLAKLTNDSSGKIDATLQPYKSNAEALRTALTNIIKFEIDAAEEGTSSKKKMIWNIIEVAKKSSDPRVPLLSGYRALSELNASAFTQSLHDATGQASKANSATEFEASLLLLVGSAKADLQAIDDLRTLNDQTGQEAGSLRQSIIGFLALKAKDSAASDQIAVRVADALADLPAGGPGLDYGLSQRIQSLIGNTYNQFYSAMRQVPELQ